MLLHMRRTARDWGRGYVPGTAPVECELYLCVLTGAVGMYQARPPVSVNPAAPALAPHVARVDQWCSLRMGLP